MKLTPAAAVVFLLALPALCLAGKKHNNNQDNPPDTQATVTSVTPTTGNQGTIAISDSDAPFVVGAQTAILIDGTAATINDVKTGMQVMTRTAPGSSMSEIDLKKADDTPPTTKHKKKQSSDSSNQ